MCGKGGDLSLVLVADAGGALRCEARLGGLAEAAAAGSWTATVAAGTGGSPVLSAAFDLNWRVSAAALGARGIAAVSPPRASRWTLVLHEDAVLLAPRLEVQWTPLVPSASIASGTERFTRTLFKLR